MSEDQDVSVQSTPPLRRTLLRSKTKVTHVMLTGLSFLPLLRIENFNPFHLIIVFVSLMSVVSWLIMGHKLLESESLSKRKYELEQKRKPKTLWSKKFKARDIRLH